MAFILDDILAVPVKLVCWIGKKVLVVKKGSRSRPGLPRSGCSKSSKWRSWLLKLRK